MDFNEAQNQHELDIMASAFEAGVFSAGFEKKSLDRRERDVKRREDAVFNRELMVHLAEWVVEQSAVDYSTVYKFKLYNTDIRDLDAFAPVREVAEKIIANGQM